MRRQKLIQLLQRKGLSRLQANDLIDDIIDGMVSDMDLIRLMRSRRGAVLLKRSALSVGYRERRKSTDLDEFFGPKPLDVNLIRRALRGAIAVMVHLSRKRVTKLDRGARKDRRLSPAVEEQVLRALKERGYGFLVSLLPKVGNSSAQLRVIR